MVQFEVQDAKTAATRNLWRTNRIPHDNRRTLCARKRVEYEHRPGGAVGDRARSRQCGLTEVSAFIMGTQQGGHGDSVASADPTDSSFVQKSTPLKEIWLQESAADSPSGKTSPHTWHGSPHPSGSSEQRQTMRSQHVATNIMQPTTASATKSFSLLFLLMPANYTTSPPAPSNHRLRLKTYSTILASFKGKTHLTQPDRYNVRGGHIRGRRPLARRNQTARRED